jgi:hypothetical protein
MPCEECERLLIEERNAVKRFESAKLSSGGPASTTEAIKRLDAFYESTEKLFVLTLQIHEHQKNVHPK